MLNLTTQHKLGVLQRFILTKDGTKTITFDEIAAKDAPEGNGSDLGCFALPRTPVSEPDAGVSVL